MNKELKYLLEEMKDATLDYIGTNGCLYQDLEREELNLLLGYIDKLQQENKRQKEVINKAIEYIDKEIYYCLSSGDNINIYLDKLLDILKGVEE